MPLKIRLGKRSGKYKVSESDPIYANVDHVHYHQPLIENNYNNLSPPTIHRLDSGMTMVQFHHGTPARLLHQALHMQHHHPALLSHLTGAPVQIHRHPIHSENYYLHNFQSPNHPAMLNCNQNVMLPPSHHHQNHSLQNNHQVFINRQQPTPSLQNHHNQQQQMHSHNRSLSAQKYQLLQSTPEHHVTSQPIQINQTNGYQLNGQLQQRHKPSSTVQMQHQPVTAAQEQHDQSALQLSQQSSLVQLTNSTPVHRPSSLVQLNHQASNEQVYHQSSITSIPIQPDPPPPLPVLRDEDRLKLLPPYRPPPAYETFVREMYGVNVDGSEVERSNSQTNNRQQNVHSSESIVRMSPVEPPLFERATESGSSTESTTRRHGPTRWL